MNVHSDRGAQLAQNLKFQNPVVGKSVHVLCAVGLSIKCRVDITRSRDHRRRPPWSMRRSIRSQARPWSRRRSTRRTGRKERVNSTVWRALASISMIRSTDSTKCSETSGPRIRRSVSWLRGSLLPCMLTFLVTDFLTGRSTRLEFETSLQPLIAGYRNFIRLHNDILLCLLSNSFREPPPANVQSLGWSKKRRDLGVQSSHGDPAAKRLKAEVMGLTNRERARIKNIPKPDASHRLRPNSMIETRFAKLPRVPVTPQKINSCMSPSLFLPRILSRDSFDKTRL